MSSTTRVLAGLVAGLGLGAALTAASVPGDDLASIAELVGALWLDALRMTIVPLVFALLVTPTSSGPSETSPPIWP